MMTVKEVVEYLQKLPQDAIVVMQSDSAGLEHDFLDAIDQGCVYQAQERRVLYLNQSAEGVGMSAEEWERVKKSLPSCVALLPWI
jgi:hypothetical protein